MPAALWFNLTNTQTLLGLFLKGYQKPFHQPAVVG